MNTSRYNSSKVIPIKKDNKVKNYVYPQLPLGIDDVPGFIINYQDGDIVDALAYRFLNSTEENWWIIAEVNELDFPIEIEPGSEIYIPVNRA